MTEDCLPLPALTLGQIAELLPVHYVTVCRWRDSGDLPEPDYLPAGNPKRALWSVATIMEWAETRGMKLDQLTLLRIVGTV